MLMMLMLMLMMMTVLLLLMTVMLMVVVRLRPPPVSKANSALMLDELPAKPKNWQQQGQKLRQKEMQKLQVLPSVGPCFAAQRLRRAV